MSLGGKNKFPFPQSRPSIVREDLVQWLRKRFVEGPLSYEIKAGTLSGEEAKKLLREIMEEVELECE